MNKLNCRFPISANEIFSAGWCNLNCKYCYIPKKPFLKNIHRKIVEKIENGYYINELYQLYGENLEYISHWGTEPSITFPAFISSKFYDQAFGKFPKLKEISFSSNFMTDPDGILQFILSIPTTKKIKIRIQVSLDGPSWITDNQRIGGATEKIVKNVFYISKKLSKSDVFHNLQFNIKPTCSKETIKDMNKYTNVKDYYDFFESFIGEWSSILQNTGIKILKSVDPTIVVPDKYTTRDGENFYGMLLNQLKAKEKNYKYINSPDSAYYYRAKNKIPFFKEYGIKPHMFTCSAGDTQFALMENKNIGVCHRIFYIDNEEYYKALKSVGLEILKESVDKKTYDLLNKSGWAYQDNEIDIMKMLYTYRAYHDFSVFRTSTAVALMSQLVDNKQVSYCYKNKNLSALLYNLMISQSECFLENVIENGSLYIPSTSLLKLFGNGVFENILKRLIKEVSDE